jgi:hypothetical protein
VFFSEEHQLTTPSADQRRGRRSARQRQSAEADNKRCCLSALLADSPRYPTEAGDKHPHTLCADNHRCLAIIDDDPRWRGLRCVPDVGVVGPESIQLSGWGDRGGALRRWLRGIGSGSHTRREVRPPLPPLPHFLRPQYHPPSSSSSSIASISYVLLLLFLVFALLAARFRCCQGGTLIGEGGTKGGLGGS